MSRMKNRLGIFIIFIICRCVFADNGLPGVVWGAFTNGYRMGVKVQPILQKGKDSSNYTVLYFGTTNTQVVVEAYVPDEYEIFAAVVNDSAGRQIEKTKLGKKCEKKPARNAKLSDRPFHGAKRWQLLRPSPALDSQVCHFNILDHFILTKSGVYTLTVEMRVYRSMGNGDLQVESLPPCSVQFQFY